MVAAKAGNTAEVIGEVQNKTTSTIKGGRESLANSSTINTTVTISGKEIPVQFRIVEFSNIDIAILKFSNLQIVQFKIPDFQILKVENIII